LEGRDREYSFRGKEEIMLFIRKFEYVPLTGMLAILLILHIHSISLAQGDTWTYKTPMPTGRGFTSGAVVDGKIYVVGGFPTHYSVTTAVEMYDPTADTWTRMSNMPSGRCGHATCTYYGKIYVFGGVSPDGYSSATNNVYIYDPQTDTWTQKADMPYANAFCGIAVVNEIIYLIGGTTKLFSSPISTVIAYDPVTESWTQKADMPTARCSLSACVVDGKIYTFGGTDQNIQTYAYKSVEVYDPSTNTWTRKTDMLTGLFGLGTCAMNGKIYAVGGVTNGLVVVTTNKMYDPVTDTWATKSPLQVRRQTYVLDSVGDRIYAIGGSYPDPQNPSEPVVLSSVEEYNTGPTNVEEGYEATAVPSGYALSQNYPNPFNPQTTIRYDLPEPGVVRLSAYNVVGQMVRTLADGRRFSGTYSVIWDGRDDSGRDVASGVYLYRLEAEGECVQIRKMVLLR
jgi:N-acetylneuraminic acid mutarotase